MKIGLVSSYMPPIGIDTSRFRPATPEERRVARTRLGLPLDTKLVLFAGRLVEKKGLPIVIQASRRLPMAHVLVLGDGPLRSLLPDAAPNITWCRGVSADRMHECYRAADCLLLPSHGEGLPLVVQEAMASGLPVVISEDEPYAESLIPLDVCVAAPRTADAMARRVREVLTGGGMESLGARARSFAEERWSVNTMVNRYGALLEDLTAATRGYPEVRAVRPALGPAECLFDPRPSPIREAASQTGRRAVERGSVSAARGRET